MLPKITTFLLFISSVNLVYTNSEQCTATNGSKCKRDNVGNIYSKEANTKYSSYLKEIEKAKANYLPCNDKKCNCHASVISDDLHHFKNGITKTMIENVTPKGTKYQIVNNHLYRDKQCMFPARCSGIEHFLLQLLPKLPDMELIVNTRDWPQINKNYGIFGPVFSFSKTSEFYDIMYPAWAFWEGGPAIGLYPTGIGRWDYHRKQLSNVANEMSWNDKQEKGFFRGSRTSAERDPLVLLSREFPDLVDAQYTRNQAWKSDADTLHVPPATEVSFSNHCNYKYLFNFRGVAASFRFKHILLCNSLIFHVGDEWLEFFYPSLKPWIHYVPVKANASKDQIKELLEFFKDHDELAKEIADNGFSMIWDHLKMKDVTCYWHKLLKKYAKLLKFDVVLDNDLIEIKVKI